MGCEAQMTLKMPIHTYSTILTHKVSQTGLVFVCDQGSLVGLCTQDYKSLCAAVMICATLVNIQTHTDNILASLYQQLRLVKGLHNKNYLERLKILNLTTLEKRRKKEDLI